MLDSTVYIVDDEPIVRTSLVALVSSMGMAAEAFASAADFLDAFDEADSHNQCVIADLRMPELGGVELKQHLGSRGCQIPVVLMTGLTPEEIEDQYESFGIFAILEKPCRPEQLQSVIHRALEASMAPS